MEPLLALVLAVLLYWTPLPTLLKFDRAHLLHDATKVPLVGEAE